MRSSRYIRCGSSFRLVRSQTRPPLLSRSTATYSPPTSDCNSSSQPGNYLQPTSQPPGLVNITHAPSHDNATENYIPKQPGPQPRALEKTTHDPSRDNSAEKYISKQQHPQYLEELHRKVWGDPTPPPQGDIAFEPKQELDSSNNEYWVKRIGSPKPRPFHLLDGCSKKVWDKAYTEMRQGRLVSYSVTPYTAALLECRSVDEARRIWKAQDAFTIKHRWILPLVTLLATDVRQACVFLQAICPLVDPPGLTISNSIRHIYTVLREERVPRGSSATHLLCDTVIHVLRKLPFLKKRIGQRDIYALRTLVSPKRLAELYREMTSAGVEIHSYTLMQIASSLAVEPTLKRMALDILVAGLARLRDESPSEFVHELRRARWASVFTSVLHHPYTLRPRHSLPPTDQDVIAPDETWEIVLGNGLEPDLIHVTALVDSLFAFGRGDAAWEVFDLYIGEKGMPMSVHLTTTLLHGSKMIGSLPYMERALGIAASRGELNEILGTAILHLVLTIALADKKRIFSSFRIMRRLFSRMFRTEPLDALIPERLRGVVDPDPSLEDMLALPGFSGHLDKLFAAQKGTLMDPPMPALEAMAMSWICSLKQGLKGPALIAFYGHYRGMLKQRHPVALGIVEHRSSIIHDMIIKGLGSSATHLRSALEIIGDMLRDHEEAAQQPAGKRDMLRDHEKAVQQPTRKRDMLRDHEKAAQPSSGWQDMLRAAQPSGGELGTTRAEEARIVYPRPTTYTWNILLDAWMQNFKQESVGRIVGLMKKHGVQPTLVTWNTILKRAGQKDNTQLAVKAAQEIRDGGFVADEFTVSGFATLPDKERFLYKMQRSERGRTRPGNTEGGAKPRREASGSGASEDT